MKNKERESSSQHGPIIRTKAKKHRNPYPRFGFQEKYQKQGT